MKKQLFIFAILLTFLISFQMIAQKVESERNRSVITIPEKISKAVLDPLPSGTYSIGTGGYFPTIDSAFNKLSIDGIAGPVTLELIDELYQTEDNGYFMLDGPIQGADPDNRITIRPVENKNVIVEGNGYDVFYFLDVSYLTLDGINLTGSTTLTIHSIYNALQPGPSSIDFQDNSDHNIVRNVTMVTDDHINGLGIDFWASSTSISPDSNLIENNLIKEARIAIFISTSNSTKKATGNVIRGNYVGTETDSLIAWGIQAEFCQNTIIENNEVQNVRLYGTNTLVIGINSYFGTSDIIRNNVVHNISALNSNGGSVGILLSGTTNEYGTDNVICNNMVYDIKGTSNISNSRITGIQTWYQNRPGIYYNSVNLTGSGSNGSGSAALYLNTSSSNIVVKNNILVNSRDEAPYCASSIFVRSGSTITSDYNDLHYTPSQYNCLVKVQTTDYLTLADWQATGNDLHSITEMPNFIAPNNLHINNLIPTYIESGGTPITGIETDFDGDIRNASKPDIGADEINGIVVPVELTAFTAEALDHKVILKWTTATELNNNGFEVQRKAAESDFATVGFVEGEGTTTNQKEYSYTDKELTNGKYSYRLKQVDYNGSYEYSNVIEVDVRRELIDFVLAQLN